MAFVIIKAANESEIFLFEYSLSELLKIAYSSGPLLVFAIETSLYFTMTKEGTTQVMPLSTQLLEHNQTIPQLPIIPQSFRPYSVSLSKSLTLAQPLIPKPISLVQPQFTQLSLIPQYPKIPKPMFLMQPQLLIQDPISLVQPIPSELPVPTQPKDAPKLPHRTTNPYKFSTSGLVLSPPL